MSGEISRRDLRNDSDRIMRALTEGETFIITSNDEPVDYDTRVEGSADCRARVPEWIITGIRRQVSARAEHRRVRRSNNASVPDGLINKYPNTA
jgi:hypothetical protein